MQYHGGEIFSRAANDSSFLAETMLCQMLICLQGGPKFLINMLPVAQLDAIFCQVEDQRLYVICDGNLTNQACIRKIETIEGKPRISAQGIYLLFDFVPLLKSLEIFESRKTHHSLFLKIMARSI